MEDTNSTLFLALPRKILILVQAWLWFQNSLLSKIYMIILVLTQYLFLTCDIVIIVQSWGDLDAVSESSFLLFTMLSVCVKTTIFLNSQKSLVSLLDTMNSEVFVSENKTMPVSVTSPGYELGYFSQVISITVGAAYYFSVDVLVLSMIMFGSAQLDVVMWRIDQITFKSVQFFSMIDLLLTMITQLYLFCWAGNSITSKSEKVRDCLYLSSWYDQDQRFQRIMVIAMECMKRNIVIKAGHIVPLCWPTFVSILRASYSYFAVLSSSYSNEDAH